ncbi:hypothetical protein BV378_12325 [Nostoc sp. RF31YmG]|nr:hypothetical protein BV378_12325 [Nostoc sp. RF31YmG]
MQAEGHRVGAGTARKNYLSKRDNLISLSPLACNYKRRYLKVVLQNIVARLNYLYEQILKQGFDFHHSRSPLTHTRIMQLKKKNRIITLVESFSTRLLVLSRVVIHNSLQ